MRNIPKLPGRVSQLKTAAIERLPKLISEKVGDALPGVAANLQVGPTFSEIYFGK